MSSRRRARQFALQALYTSDLAEMPVAQAMTALWSGAIEGEGIEADGKAPEGDEIEFAQRIAYGVDQKKVALDALIDTCSTNWRIPRMPVVDRNVLRVAAYELMECQDIPATVTINEAVELAKRYGAAESRAFVNGIVDRMARQLGRIDAKRPTKG